MHIPLQDLLDGEPFILRGSVPGNDSALGLSETGTWSVITFDFTAIRTENECLVRGTLQTTVTRDCDRCLDPLEFPVNCDFTHSYDCSNIQAIDLTPDVREDILLSLPMAFRCELDDNDCCPHSGKCHRSGSRAFEEIRRQEAWRDLDKLEEK